jgi:hypothetical protein
MKKLKFYFDSVLAMNHIGYYQSVCRIYLDEYEVEEVDLRVNFDTSLLMKRFMVKE